MIDHTQVRTVRASDTARVQPMERASRVGGYVLLGLAVLAIVIAAAGRVGGVW